MDASDPCGVATATQVADLAGMELEPNVHDISGTPACVWGDLDATAIQTILVDSAVWALSAPAAFAQLMAIPEYVEAMSDEARAAEALLAEVEADAQIDSAGAREMFSLMLIADGLEEGSNFVTRLVPSAEYPQGITAQGCIDGVFGSVLLAAPDLTGSADEADRVADSAMAILGATS